MGKFDLSIADLRNEVERDLLHNKLSPEEILCFEKIVSFIEDESIEYYRSIIKIRKYLDRDVILYKGESVILKHVIVHLTKKAEEYLQQGTFPPLVESRIREWLAMALRACLVKKAEWFSLGNELLVKDIAVCSFRFYPMGLLVVGRSPFPRRPLLRTGVKFFKNLHIAFNNSEFYEMHLDKRMMRYFNPEGAREAYLNIASMVSRFDWQGVFGGGWLNDPALKTVDPKISFLNDIPLSNGAQLIPAKTQQHFVEGAILHSKKRRQLYEDGVYRPQKYFLCWERQHILEWYSKNS